MILIRCKMCNQDCVKYKETIDYRGNIWYHANCRIYGDMVVLKEDIIKELDIGPPCIGTDQEN